MNERERRLRERIDEHLDERALTQAKLSQVVRARNKFRERARVLAKSRDLWRQRAIRRRG